MTERSDKPGIVVLGSPRSGTTLLRRILDAHPAIACPGETNLFTGCGRFLREERMADGTAIGAPSGLSFMGVEPGRLLADMRRLAFTYLDEYAASKGKQRWAEKTAFNAFYLDELEPLWSDNVVFVVILRHGLDVAGSIRDLSDANGAYLDEIHDYLHSEPVPLVAFAKVWVDLTEKLLDFQARHAGRAVLLRYENLVRDPEAELGRMFEFLQESWSPEMLASALGSFDNIGLGDWKTYERKTITDQSVDKWRRIPTHLLERLATVVNPTLERCGYAPVESSGGDDDDARRRYELSLLLGRLKSGE